MLRLISEYLLPVINLFKPNGLSHPYQLDQSISNLKDQCSVVFSFLHKFYRHYVGKRSAACTICLHPIINDARLKWSNTKTAVQVIDVAPIT